MKKRLFLMITALITASLLIACSSKPSVATKETEVNNSTPQTDEQTIKPKTVFNTQKPTTYAEYKRWRKENSPVNDAYSEYKEWEINYRRWKAQQDQ